MTRKTSDSDESPDSTSREMRELKALLRQERVELEQRMGEMANRLLSIDRDVREHAIGRRQAEIQLEQAKDFLAKIINSVADPIFVKDRQHRFVLLNDACCEIIGRKREMLIGKSDYDFFPKEEADIFWEKDEAVFRTGSENANEETITDRQGVRRIVSTKKALYIDSKGEPYIVGVIRDITDRKRIEESLKTSREELQRRVDERTRELRHVVENLQAEVLARKAIENELAAKAGELVRSNAELKQFAATVSDGFRQPLHSITELCAELLSCADQLPGRNVKERIRELRENALQMNEIISALFSSKH